MGICNQIHDNVPKRWIKEDHWKYPLTHNQTDIIKVFDRSIRFDIVVIIEEWRIVDMMCECIDLLKEMEEMKHHGHVSRVASPVGTTSSTQL